MKWLEKLFGPANYRQYGENEFYEYSRHRSSEPSRSDRDSGWHSSGASSGYGGWRGPSIFEDPYTDMYSNRGGNHNPYQDMKYLHQDERFAHSYADLYGAVPSESNSTGRLVTQPQWRTSTEEVGLANKDANKVANKVANKDADSSDDDSSRDDDEENESDEDEDLSKALHETLNLKYPPPYGTSNIAPAYTPSMTPALRSAGISSCAGCHRPLGFGRFLTCLNQNWHPACFCCCHCSKAIVDREFSVQGNEPYHRDCYKALFHPKCEICHVYIPPNGQGLIEYRSHPFWNQKYCPSHEKDGRKRCCSCDRIEPTHSKYIALEDGRRLCSECNETAVMDTKDCQPLFKEILKFYKNLGMNIEQQIPMLLVEREALNNAREVEKDEHVHAPETRGLCLSEEQTITTVFGNSPDAHGGYPEHHETEVKKLTRHCEVTAILILYGLPRLLTGSILAHELMHAWLRLDGNFPNLENDVEEGICQVIAHIWLRSELEFKSTRKTATANPNANTNANLSYSAATKRLGEFFLHQIETDASPVYGDGFRSAYAAASKYGLVKTLAHLRKTGRILG